MALQESGIRSTQFALLVGIAKNQPVSVGNLADVLAIDSTTLTRSLRLLQKEGLVAISNRAAMRQRFLTITAKGERTLARSLPAWTSGVDESASPKPVTTWPPIRSVCIGWLPL